jgi:hypothetical protein
VFRGIKDGKGTKATKEPLELEPKATKEPLDRPAFRVTKAIKERLELEPKGTKATLG